MSSKRSSRSSTARRLRCHKKPLPTYLREVAKRRLQRLAEPTPEQIEKEVEQARREGYRIVRGPGVSIWIQDYSLEDPQRRAPGVTAGSRCYIGARTSRYGHSDEHWVSSAVWME